MEKEDLPVLVRSVAERLQAKKLRMATAESCTGGWIAKVCTDKAGSSAWFECGFITYSNASKQAMLGVADETLAQFGAVSEETAAEMVCGAIAQAQVDAAVAVTGIAGPGGATPTKPVGTVCFGWQVAGQSVQTATMNFAGDRDAVRQQTVVHSLRVLCRMMT